MLSILIAFCLGMLLGRFSGFTASYNYQLSTDDLNRIALMVRDLMKEEEKKEVESPILEKGEIIEVNRVEQYIKDHQEGDISLGDIIEE